ncbi:MAG: tetratricopeptide repeat protein [Deltaproteobacteria bacterium]|nr:tetratricopeptide repeat protein [Deltaproteobacteria bacterium]
MTRTAACILPLACTFFLAAPPADAWNPLQSKNGKVKSGNKKFDKEKYGEALESYDKAALQLPDEAAVHFNRGDALFKMGAGKSPEEDSGELDRAARAYADAISLAGEEQEDIKTSAFYNMGNVRFAQGRWEEAIAAYRQALKLQPGHTDAAYNLALALKKLEEEKKKEEEEKKKKEEEEEKKKEEEKKEQEKQEQEKKENEEQCDSGQEEKEGEGQQEKKEQEEQGQGEQEQQEQQPSPEQEQQQQGQQGEQEQAQQPVPVTKQEAEAILDALQRGESNLKLEQLRGQHGGYGSPKVDKDW